MTFTHSGDPFTNGGVLFLIVSSENTIISADGYVQAPQVECVSGRKVLWTRTDCLVFRGLW